MVVTPLAVVLAMWEKPCWAYRGIPSSSPVPPRWPATGAGALRGRGQGGGFVSSLRSPGSCRAGGSRLTAECRGCGRATPIWRPAPVLLAAFGGSGPEGPRTDGAPTVGCAPTHGRGAAGTLPAEVHAMKDGRSPLVPALTSTLLFALLPASSSGQDPWVTYPAGDGPGAGRKVVLIAGDEEYRSEEAMPMLGKLLSVRHGFECVVLFSIDAETGAIDPEEQTNIPGLEALADADLMIIATRFRELPDEQMKHVVDYVESGRPIVGPAHRDPRLLLPAQPGQSLRALELPQRVLARRLRPAGAGRHLDQPPRTGMGSESTRGVAAPGRRRPSDPARRGRRLGPDRRLRAQEPRRRRERSAARRRHRRHVARRSSRLPARRTTRWSRSPGPGPTPAPAAMRRGCSRRRWVPPRTSRARGCAACW